MNHFIGSNRALRFMIITFLISISSWGTAAFVGLTTDSATGMGLIVLGGISPFLSALINLFAFHESTFRRDYLKRVWPSLKMGTWYLKILIVAGTIPLGAGIITWAAGGDIGQFMLIEPYRSSPWKLLPFAFFILFFGPVPEELGWRGYALEALSLKTNRLTASLLLGLCWGFWHVPLFFIQGYPLAEMEFTPLRYLVYFGDLLPKSILYTWIYYKTGRHIFSAVLFHFAANYLGSIIEIEIITELYQFFILTLAAGLVVLRNRQLFFSRNAQDGSSSSPMPSKRESRSST